MNEYPPNTSMMKVESTSYERITLQKATVCLVLFLIVSQAAICVAEDIPGTFSLRSSGARPMGMAGVFTAPADDVNALWFNPAGIAQLTKNEVSSMYAKLYGVEKLYYSALGFAMPVRRGLGSVGIGWTRLAAGEVLETDESGNIIRSSSQKENALTISYGSSIFKKDIIFLGGNLRYLHAGPLASSSGWGIDLGILGKPIPQLSMGLVVQQLAGELTVKETGESRTLPRNINAAVALDLGNYLLSAEVSNITSAHYRKVGLGAEVWLLDNLLGLRAGLRRRLAENANLLFSLGASVKIADYLRLDYAYLAHPILADSHILSANFSFLKIPDPIKITDVIMQKELFPSQSTYYANNPISAVKLKESSGRTFNNVKISLFIPGYMRLPSETITQVKAYSAPEIQLSAVLDNEAVYKVDENIAITAQIKLEYYDGEEKRHDSRTYPMILYNRNTLDWRTPESFAAFITHNDDVIRNFAGGIQQKESGLPPNLAQAMLLYDAIASYGVRYSPDARINRISPLEKSPLDNVKYPREALNLKDGDCDDWTAAYAACLENMGIPTAIILVPYHVFLMFDTGIPVRDFEKIILDENMFTSFTDAPPARTRGVNGLQFVKGENDNVWLPVEVTMLSGGAFTQAWIEGVKEYKAYERTGQLKIIYTKDAQKTYPPLKLPGPAPRIDLPVAGLVSSAFENDQSEYNKIYRGIVEQKKREMTNNAAVSLAKIGEYEAAEKILLRLPKNTRTHLNLGNLYCIKGKPELALEQYDKVLADEPQNTLVLLNEGLLHLMLSIDSVNIQEAEELESKAVEYFTSALQSLAGRLDILSSEETERPAYAQRAGRRLMEAHQEILRLLGIKFEALREKGKKVRKLSAREVEALLMKAREKLAGVKKLLFSIKVEFQGDLDSGKISAGLRKEFKNNKVSLSQNAKISIKEKGSKWLITDSGQKYAVMKEESKLNVSILPKPAKEVIARRGIELTARKELSFWLNWSREK